jgi:hypothetical protein
MSAAMNESDLDERADDQLALVEEVIKAGKDDCLTSTEIIGNVIVALGSPRDPQVVAWRFRYEPDDEYVYSEGRPTERLPYLEPLYTHPSSTVAAKLRYALTTCRDFIQGEPIENAVVGMGSMQSLGEMIDDALSSRDDGETEIVSGAEMDAIEQAAIAGKPLAEAPSTIPADVLAMKEACKRIASDYADRVLDRDTKSPDTFAINAGRLDAAKDIAAAISRIDAPPYCTCPCSCDETPHDGTPCELHGGVVQKGLVSAPQITMADIRKKVGPGMVTSVDVIDAANDLMRERFDFTPKQGVAVRPLCWEKQNVDGTLWCSEVSICGEYRVRHSDDRWFATVSARTIGGFKTCDEAKAAAQVDYETRIKSALDMEARGSVAVAWRWRTLPRYRESGDDGGWTLLERQPAASDFMNPHHHEIEPLYAHPSSTRAVSVEELAQQICDVDIRMSLVVAMPIARALLDKYSIRTLMTKEGR